MGHETNNYTNQYWFLSISLFTDCLFCLISFIVLLIQLIVIRYSVIRALVYFMSIQLFNDLTHPIILMHLYSYLITKIFHLHFQFYHIPTTILLWSHNVCCLNNVCRDQGKFSCSLQTNTFVSNFFVNTTKHDYTISIHCYLYHHFYVCPLQVICLIIFQGNQASSITSRYKQFLFWINNTFVKIDSFHIFDEFTSYFITRIQYLYFIFYHNPNTIFTLN